MDRCWRGIDCFAAGNTCSFRPGPERDHPIEQSLQKSVPGKRGGCIPVSRGHIDWNILASNDICFAFIKATEGSTHVDPCFQYNYEESRKTSLRIGVYHFFSYDSEGQTQADNYIAVVEKTDDMLPPVIDLEFYGDKEQNPPAGTR